LLAGSRNKSSIALGIDKDEVNEAIWVMVKGLEIMRSALYVPLGNVINQPPYFSSNANPLPV
jgi:hypothetical protein